MIRWVVVIFLALALFLPLFPELARLRLGKLPADVWFRVGGKALCLPFGSTVALSALAFLAAELLKLL